MLNPVESTLTKNRGWGYDFFAWRTLGGLAADFRLLAWVLLSVVRSDYTRYHLRFWTAGASRAIMDCLNSQGPKYS